MENKNRSLIQEIDNLKRGKTDNEYKITQITQEWQMKITQITQEWQNKYQSSEDKLGRLSQENDDLRRKIRELDEYQYKTSEYEGRIFQFSQELERLNSIINGKADENKSLENRLRALNQENEDLRRHLQ